MKRSVCFILAFAILCVDSSASAIEGLAGRILGSRAGKFVFTEQPCDSSFFKISQEGRKIHITGDCTVSQAEGLNWYLKHVAGVHVSWFADQPVQLPLFLPKVKGTVEHKAQVDNRFFLNYCTFGYTMPWWSWEQWEHFIDWMALNGINMPFSLTGQEAVWMEVWKEFGMTEDQIRAYFSGPAHLPWHRMANLDSYQGPLPYSWIDDQKNLETQIVGRERELGMTPVLPAFAGHVPEYIKETHPESDIKTLSSWCEFKPTYFMNAEDPLFAEIQKLYLEKQTALYGTDHIYGFDPFNEMDPPSWEPEYLAEAGRNIFSTLTAADPQAKWLQMGWLFFYQSKDWTNERINAYLTSVPQGDLYILDYFCERVEIWRRTESFFGQPFIFCYLGNFGGNTRLHGDIGKLDKQMTDLFRDAGDNLFGVGSTLESFDPSPHIYEFLFDRVWNATSDVDEWYSDWAALRAGRKMENAQKAWDILSKEIYVDGSAYWKLYGRGVQSVYFPYIDTDDPLDYTSEESLAQNARLLEVCRLLLSKTSRRDAYRYDIVNFLSQYLSNSFCAVRQNFAGAFKAGDVAAMKEYAAQADELFADMDAILNTHPDFMVGKWISDARKKGLTDEEKDYYEMNARTILTIWGDTGVLDDYASRNWGGLIGDYYIKRWDILFDEAIASVEAGAPFDMESVTGRIVEFENSWVMSKDKYPDRPVGNTVSVARKILRKYN